MIAVRIGCWEVLHQVANAIKWLTHVPCMSWSWHRVSRLLLLTKDWVAPSSLGHGICTEANSLGDDDLFAYNRRWMSRSYWCRRRLQLDITPRIIQAEPMEEPIWGFFMPAITARKTSCTPTRTNSTYKGQKWEHNLSVKPSYQSTRPCHAGLTSFHLVLELDEVVSRHCALHMLVGSMGSFRVVPYGGRKWRRKMVHLQRGHESASYV